MFCFVPFTYILKLGSKLQVTQECLYLSLFFLLASILSLPLCGLRWVLKFKSGASSGQIPMTYKELQGMQKSLQHGFCLEFVALSGGTKMPHVKSTRWNLNKGSEESRRNHYTTWMLTVVAEGGY